MPPYSCLSVAELPPDSADQSKAAGIALSCSVPQDLPAFGVGLQYAATLASTLDVVQAVQQTHQCRQGILTGQIPARQPADPLPALPSAFGNLALSLQPSPDSKLCAVVYGCEEGYDPDMMTIRPEASGLALYETHTGRLLHSLRRNDGRFCVVHWSACSTRLNVDAQGPRVSPPVVEIYEAGSGLVVTPTWSPQAAEVLAKRSPIGGCTWSPDGKHLLICNHAVDGRLLHVLHTQTGALLASAPMTDVPCISACTIWGYLTLPLIWHPSSIGFAVPACSFHLSEDSSALSIFRAAQIKVGHCPSAVHLETGDTQFSADCKFLIAPAYVECGEGTKDRVAVMQCIEEAECLSFPLLHVLGDVHSPVSETRWCPKPGTHALLLRKDNALRLATLHGQPMGSPAPAEICLREYYGFSPCGRLCQVMREEAGRQVPYLLHCSTGTVLSVPGSSSELGLGLRWSSCGSCILQQVGRIGLGYDEQQYSEQSFTVLRFTAS